MNNNRIRIGVLGPSEIAQRRTIPAILKSDFFEYVGVAFASEREWNDSGVFDLNVVEIDKNKALGVQQKFGGEVFNSFSSLIQSDAVDAVYIPLPPGVHKMWAIKALSCGKHILLEKPFATNEKDATEIIQLAIKKNLIVHENYAFIYHSQIARAKEIIDSGELGDKRMIKASFSFPYRGQHDFRYHKEKGGGALLDCAGYPIKLIAHILGYDMKLVNYKNYSSKGHDVDVYGYALFQKDDCFALATWGMDNTYKCDFEYNGSLGKLYLQRAYSPTAEMKIKIEINANNEQKDVEIEPCDQFLESVNQFGKNIQNSKCDYDSIIEQAKIIDKLKEDDA